MKFQVLEKGSTFLHIRRLDVCHVPLDSQKNFGFAAKPQIKSWQRADNALSDSDSDDSDVKVDDQAFDDADILDFCT